MMQTTFRFTRTLRPTRLCTRLSTHNSLSVNRNFASSSSSNSSNAASKSSPSSYHHSAPAGFASASHKSDPGQTMAEQTQRIIKFSLNEVSKHNTEDDCWIVIHNKVYNITQWIDRHPGGDVILTKAGGDSTELFEEFSHPLVAREIMKDYYIGELEESDKINRYTAGTSRYAGPEEAVFDVLH
eukprot:TRINITY_DN687_c0_g1_i1.p1 TRINITY_DN687_c0_g1~~TRINITY_DN687_c0_g1_i1.p1  ORF type:complete len:184 (-),score=25.70 TRINITY_DN687_c0_g1_i1:41-592(-)